MKDQLGWEPSVDFPEGIQKTFDWYKEHEEWSHKLMDKIEERKHKKVSKTPLETSRV